MMSWTFLTRFTDTHSVRGVGIFNLNRYVAMVWSIPTTSSEEGKYSVVESYSEWDTFLGT